MEQPNINSKAVQLAKKLLAMVQQGESGEADNAGRMLHDLLERHHLTIEDIEREEKHKCEYDIMLKHQDLFFALCWHVIDKWDGKYWHKSKDRRYIGIMLTNAEQIELTAKFDFYVRHYDEQIALFTRSFIHANKLYAKESNIDDTVHKPDPDIWKVLSLASGIQYKPWHDRLQQAPIDKSHQLNP